MTNRRTIRLVPLVEQYEFSPARGRFTQLHNLELFGKYHISRFLSKNLAMTNSSQLPWLDSSRPSSFVSSLVSSRPSSSAAGARGSLLERLVLPPLVPADLFLNVLWCCTAWNLPVWPRPREKIFFLHVILYIRLLVHLDSLRLFFDECCWQPCSPWALGIGNTESTYMVLQCHDYDNVLFVIICCYST